MDAPAAAGVPVALGRTAYRIVQEGLTNARKHAPAAAVEVVVEGGDGELVVSVLSRRPLRTVADATPAAGLPAGAGTGLIGLGERVALAGGSCATARTPAETSCCARRCRGRRDPRPAGRRRRARPVRPGR